MTGRWGITCRRTKPRRYTRCPVHLLAYRAVPVLLTRSGIGANKGSVSLENTWRQHVLEPDMFAVPMPFRGGRAWLQSSPYGNVEMPAFLACRPRSGVLVRS